MSTPNLIQFHDLVYRYPPAQEGESPVTALDGISLTIAPGEFLGVTGTTGSGKSTLCLALNGLVPHATGGLIRGEVLIGDWNTKQMSVPQLATRVGLVFQDPESNLVGLTVEDEVAFGSENLGVAPTEIAERVDWALALVGMRAARERSVNQLSGGQKQRVAIAAVLAMRPVVLVLDEPTAQLDPLGKFEVAAAIENLRQESDAGMTVVMVEQDAELLSAFADRLIVLDQGKIALEGTPRALFRRLEQFQQLGVAVPQVSEVAASLNAELGTDLNVLTRHEARQALITLLSDPPDVV